MLSDKYVLVDVFILKGASVMDSLTSQTMTYNHFMLCEKLPKHMFCQT